MGEKKAASPHAAPAAPPPRSHAGASSGSTCNHASHSASSGGGTSTVTTMAGSKRQREGTIEYLGLPDGVLDEAILNRVSAIAQQNVCCHCFPSCLTKLTHLCLLCVCCLVSVFVAQCHSMQNCVGVDGRGLAAGVAAKLPYGCPYADRRPMPPARRFAVPEDRATPGTIEVRKAPAAVLGAPSRPSVICLYAQFEMGGPDKYKRVTPMPPSDGKAAREGWFRQCLAAIAQLSPPPSSVAFPHEIGCGLAGGDWPRYDAMLKAFADANPSMEVLVVRWTGGGGGAAGGGPNRGMGGRGGGGGRGVCFKCSQPGHWANACPRGR